MVTASDRISSISGETSLRTLNANYFSYSKPISCNKCKSLSKSMLENGETHIQIWFSPNPQKVAAHFPGWWNNIDISHACQKKISSNVTPSFPKNNLKKRKKFHHQHMNAECHFKYFFFKRSACFFRAQLSPAGPEWSLNALTVKAVPETVGQSVMSYSALSWNTVLLSAWRPRRESASSRWSGGLRTRTQSWWPPCSWPGSGSALSPAACRTRWGRCRAPGRTRSRALGSSMSNTLQHQHESALKPQHRCVTDTQVKYLLIFTWHSGVGKEEICLHRDLMSGISISLQGIVGRTRICLYTVVKFRTPASLVK